ncbi:S-layer homology domain-containing protein [Actinomarinicola tropica]|uniref:S-layer homology domain-containing protein n=1 Tax=Actinomarinicola tropica TaxID=2789776 RepID=UPI001E4A170F|nr:S-layer homology domain-containing protein [Actinomarinicola tropica]
MAHGAFYATAVRWLAGEGITTGVGGSDRFAPEAPVTRGEMATFLWRHAGAPASGGPLFADVAHGAFYATAVRWLAAEGITTGVGGSDRFAPDAAVTRGEMATFLWRFDHRGHGAAAGQSVGTATLGGPPSTSGPASPPQAPEAAVRLY